MAFALICSWGSIFMWLISIFSQTQPKIGTNQALKGKIYSVGLIYTASIAYMIILSQHLVPRDTESPAVPPPNFAFWGTVKKISVTRRPRPPKTCTSLRQWEHGDTDTDERIYVMLETRHQCWSPRGQVLILEDTFEVLGRTRTRPSRPWP